MRRVKAVFASRRSDTYGFHHTGLIQTGLLERYSLAHFLMIVPFALAQVYAIVTMLRLDAKLIRPARPATEAIEAAAA